MPKDSFRDDGQSDDFAHIEIISDIARRSQKLISDFASRHASEFPEFPELPQMPKMPKDPVDIGGAYFDLASSLASNPVKMMLNQVSLWQDYFGLWQNTASKMMGMENDPAIEPAKDDRRFKDPDWSENHVFDYIKQSYLITSRWLENVVSGAEGLDPETAHKVEFFTRCYVEALSPTNFAMTNPQVMRETMETKGENLLTGLQNLLSDFERGDGKLKISMTDEDAFEIGVNIATTPGKVVYRNELIELIQFEPSTPKVQKRPLLIVTPWINKYYILDLREKNSFVKWSVNQGHTVFVISWINPGELAHKNFADYMLEGPLEALVAIEKATGEREINVVGYCIGGTLVAAAMAWANSPQNKDSRHWKGRMNSLTFLTTLVDFEEQGDLSVFIDEAQVSVLEEKMNARGYLEGSEMAATFNMMRSSDLIWSFVINNYLMGKSPFPFDLLYWNGDSTRMPAAMQSFYLRNFHLNNKLSTPGGIELAGVPIDLGNVDGPIYMISAHDDHIAPWGSTFKANKFFCGDDKRFVLTASGHIAGIINPPVNKKYHYWTNDVMESDPEVWLDKAKRLEGSWWTDWSKWVKKHGGPKLAARTPGEGKLDVIEDAPGSYVKVRS